LQKTSIPALDSDENAVESTEGIVHKSAETKLRHCSSQAEMSERIYI